MISLNCYKKIECILSDWRLDAHQKYSILGCKTKNHNAIFNLQELLTVIDECTDIHYRVELILHIASSLKITFNNPKNINGFMKMKNGNQPFNGTCPIDLACESLSGLETVDSAITQIVKI
ncbi:hypothetical protein [Pseudoalteromonas sp. B62]|uniref:hypothetical protein n=1 Tax=Pseudoalteromonas sp. B62 TaxID=630483 RepID=UPI00301C2D97